MSKSFNFKEALLKIRNLLFDALTNGIFKVALLMILAIRVTQQTADPSNLIAGLLVMPFFLFSARTNVLAKKYGQFKITRSVQLADLGLMIFAGTVLLTTNAILLILLPLSFGIISIYWGPMRYALQPELLETDKFVSTDLSASRSTYAFLILAVLIGILMPVRLAALCLIIFAVAGYLISRTMPVEEAKKTAKPSGKELGQSVLKTLRLVKRYPLIYRSILGETWFWSIGLLMLLSFYHLVLRVFNAEPNCAAFFMVLFVLGTGVGVRVCRRLLKGVLHTTFVPLSTIGIAICFVLLTFLIMGYKAPEQVQTLLPFICRLRVIAFGLVVLCLAFCCGMYITPLNMLMREKATDANRAVVFAANNIINAIGIATMGLFVVVCTHLGFNMAARFMIAAFLCCIVALYNCTVLPAALVRSIVQTILEFTFRVTTKGLPHFTEAGKRVLIVSNHTSLLDGLLIAAFMPEKVMFVIKPEWENKWFAKLFKLMVDVTPLDMNNALSLRTLIDLIKKNNKVMIFPEQRISVTGALMKVYEGAGVIAEKANANILPVRINGAQYSKFSLMKNRIRTQFFPKITINIMPPKKFDIDPNLTGRQRSHEVSLQLYNMMSDMMYHSSKINENLFVALLNASHIFGKNHVIAEDISRQPMRYKQLILKSYVLGETVRRLVGEEEERVGILMPNVLANVVLLYSLFGIDKVPAMLNFSSGITQILSCTKTVQLKTVITSHKFIENGKFEKLEQALKDAGLKILYMEEIGASISRKDKFKGVLASLIRRKPKRKSSQTAVILFTSGSEGMPKAVFLNHQNFLANCKQVLSVLAIGETDVFFNALPMFHAFGLGVGTILTTTLGVKSFYYPSPLHYRVIPELAYASNATIICGTDTFFAGYGASAHPYDFFNLRLAVAGAEKLKESTSKLWSEKFGVRIMEGYGATETAPLISFNTPMYVKKGSVGRLLPGMEARLEEVPGITEGKRLFVRGDNIMQGYMKADNPGVLQPPEDGWHDTGDIVDIDKDGFITILGRAKRFAKIGGEMVSLTAIETIVNSIYENEVSGVVAISDPKKGEQLVLITTHENADPSEIKTAIKNAGLNDLGSPSKILYVKEPPLLGTGKFDYVTATKLATEKFGQV